MNLTAREKIGQRLVVGLSGTEIDDELENLISKYKIANVILFKKNIVNATQIKALCNNLQKLVRKHTGRGAFITIDQEGGMVTRLENDCVNVPGAMAIAATGKVENAYEGGKITGEQLRALGINFNLAPVVDINSNMDNPVIGVRSYGDNKDKVAEYALSMTKGLLNGGVMAAAKHFPGHGDTDVDSHLGLPKINKSIEELKKLELFPFQKMVNEGIPAIITAHILFPQLEEEEVPATMSRKIVTGLLKNEMGFKGLVISDCMEMQAVQKYYGTIEGVKRAILAGVDLILISHTARLAREASDLLTEALEMGEISLEEMDDSLEKIFCWKEKYVDVLDTDSKFNIEIGKQFAYQLRKETITSVNTSSCRLQEIGKNPLFLGCEPFRATNVSNKGEGTYTFVKAMKNHFGGQGIITSPNPKMDEIYSVLKCGECYSSIVIATYNGHLYKGQLELVNEAEKRNEKVIVVALRNPYDLKELPENVYKIAAYEYTEDILKVLIELFEGNIIEKGILPVEM